MASILQFQCIFGGWCLAISCGLQDPTSYYPQGTMGHFIVSLRHTLVPSLLCGQLRKGWDGGVVADTAGMDTRAHPGTRGFGGLEGLNEWLIGTPQAQNCGRVWQLRASFAVPEDAEHFFRGPQRANKNVLGVKKWLEIFFLPNTGLMMTFLDPLVALIPKIPFSLVLKSQLPVPLRRRVVSGA